ncbi:FusB/FusC family EF-G-binding protein [Lactococcus raffinolactis]|uniref:FusB/FusC family EF-G-binding protein n=1 Tax=Pseudolactococcus raffinolactis TaxID=1366 RepID=UPI00288EE550|nr:FusB/FusC family EF-G-binding protein [Lactococcus raffinolactis]MDT2767131.1 FusB/FusC family EF-G-binding protein [Lactococcus raffinolactis]MDT2790370.1 FusB/FusC family EF-G-binding protein [Lactococcus raffinolactis]
MYPYQYFSLFKTVDDLINVYQSVNDKSTVAAIKAQALAKFDIILPEKFDNFDTFLKVIFDEKLTKASAKTYFEVHLKPLVSPFKVPSNKVVEKVFRKVKKIQIPNWSSLDLRENTYVAWHDPGQGRKFILFYDEHDKLQGTFGEFGSNAIKGLCAICQEMTTISLFLATTKSSGDGTYTKKGNYICLDSDACNQHLYDLSSFHGFLNALK